MQNRPTHQNADCTDKMCKTTQTIASFYLSVTATHTFAPELPDKKVSLGMKH